MAAIDELRKRLREVQQRLSDWNHAYAEAYTRLRRERVGRFRRPSADVEEQLREEARRAAGEDLARELFGFLDQLCDGYLAEKLPHNRAKLRADVGHSPDLLEAVWSYAWQGAELLRSGDDGQRLERALAAVSIDDLRADVEQVDALLARLWLAAVRAGLDPQPAFEAVAAVSNPGMGGGGACLAPRLEGFAGSLAFKREVAPQLERRPA
jgi:hypothetical protein